jgi:hypothetical protein
VHPCTCGLSSQGLQLPGLQPDRRRRLLLPSVEVGADHQQPQAQRSFANQGGQLDPGNQVGRGLRGQLGRIPAADVPHRMDRSGRDQQDLTGLVCGRRLALDLILQ